MGGKFANVEPGGRAGGEGGREGGREKRRKGEREGRALGPIHAPLGLGTPPLPVGAHPGGNLRGRETCPQGISGPMPRPGPCGSRRWRARWAGGREGGRAGGRAGRFSGRTQRGTRFLPLSRTCSLATRPRRPRYPLGPGAAAFPPSSSPASGPRWGQRVCIR